MTTNLTKGYKVTLYSDYLRATALYAIYENSPNYEYGHYTLVFNIRVQLSPFVLCDMHIGKIAEHLQMSIQDVFADPHSLWDISVQGC